MPPQNHRPVTPTVPAQTVMKHIQGSKNRIERLAKDAEYFRRGLRELQSDSIALRSALEERPDELTRMEAGLMALSYAAGGVLASIDHVIRLELSFQSEAHRWLQGKTSGIDKRRPHLAYQQAPAGMQKPEVVNGRAQRNGTIPEVAGGAYDYVKSQGVEVPTVKPDPKVAVGYYIDNETGVRTYVNAYDQIVEPPTPLEDAIAVPICLPKEKPSKPSLITTDAPQAPSPNGVVTE